MTIEAEGDQAEGAQEPSAHDVRVIFRRTNIIIGVGLLVLAIISIIGIVVAVSGRAASRDSFNATNVQLATQERNACITERRNAQNDALGRISINANQAEVAGLVQGDEDRALEYLALFNEAVADWEAATLSLSPAVLNTDKAEGGCGPPIITLEDLDDVTTTEGADQ